MEAVGRPECGTGMSANEAAGRLLAVVAHPDDESFGCGSTLHHVRAVGWTTAVLCATRGEAGELTPGTSLGPGGLGTLREQELRDAAGLLGVSEVSLLDLHDSGMTGDTPARHPRRGAVR